MNFSIQAFINALNILQQIKEEITKEGIDLGKWVDVAVKLFPAVVSFLEIFNSPTPTPTAMNFAAVKATVEAEGIDFGKWINLLIKIAPLIQQLIDNFTKK